MKRGVIKDVCVVCCVLLCDACVMCIVMCVVVCVVMRCEVYVVYLLVFVLPR